MADARPLADAMGELRETGALLAVLRPLGLQRWAAELAAGGFSSADLAFVESPDDRQMCDAIKTLPGVKNIKVVEYNKRPILKNGKPIIY